MRVEPFAVGSYVHAIKRGARGLPIVRTEDDRLRFVRSLYLLNEKYKNENWDRQTAELAMFERPASWPEREQLTSILGWVLMPNHFHLLLKEIVPGGVAKFMQRLCGSMSTHFNAKYKEKGSIFQGGYRGRTVDTDGYLRQVMPYIMVKNVFELYPHGFAEALGNFDSAWGWAAGEYVFSSLPEYARQREWPIVEKDLVAELFPNAKSFKKHAREILLSRKEVSKDLRILAGE